MSKVMMIAPQEIENRIFSVRGIHVMLDSDLAQMYQSETKYINRAVKRNPDRFPADFAFQLDEKEWENLKFQSGTSRTHGGRRTPNEQYGGFKINFFDKSHDRFLIIDNEEVYHLGASLKDLGKRWFAFSKLDKNSVENILKSIVK